MAYTNLTDLFTAIADAIRQKTGKTVLINPQDFPAEILAIPSGGSTTYYIKQTIEGNTCILDISDTAISGAGIYSITVSYDADTQILDITDASGAMYYIVQSITGNTCSLAITDTPSAGGQYSVVATISGDTQSLAITD